MPIIRKTVIAGRTKTVTECLATNYGKKLRRKAENHNPTPEDVEKVNQRRAEQELTYMVDHNFGPGDLYVTFTYPKDSRPKTKADAERRFGNFIKRLKRRCEKLGIELKWIKVTEVGGGENFHHHVIMNHMDTAVIAEVWAQEGFAFIKHLDQKGHYPILAEYLVKEREKRKKMKINGRGWSYSSNLKKPKREVKILKRCKINKDIPVSEGYYLDKDSVVRIIHEVSGFPYLKYTLVKLQDKRKRRKGGGG